MPADDTRRRESIGGGDERSDARERSMMLLYEAATKRCPVAEIVDAQVTTPDPLALVIVQGVHDNAEQIDAAIAAHAKGWTLARMPLIDLTVMRIAAFELMHRLEVPVAVVLNEAVELAKRFSTDDSGRFVNGVLSALVPGLRPATTAD